MRVSTVVLAAALLAGSVLLLSLLVAGTVGLVVTTLLASALSLGLVRGRLGAEQHQNVAARSRRSWPLEPFHSYRRIQFALRWGIGRRNQLLPQILTRLARATLARHGVDLDHDPDSARRLLGEHAWSLLEARADLVIGATDIERFADRLEQL